MQDEQEVIPDTQEEEVVATEEEAIEPTEVEEGGEETEDEPFDLGFGGEGEEVTEDDQRPLNDLRLLITQDPTKAIERVEQVEAGIEKLRSQVQAYEENEQNASQVFAGLLSGNAQGIEGFEDVLYEKTGLTLQDLADLRAGETPARAQAPKDDPRILSLEKRLEAQEAERAATKWITEKGQTISRQVAKETGLEFSPELIWQSKSQLKAGATPDDVRKAIMRVNPDAYDKAVAIRDGGIKPVPKGATMPTGRSARTKAFTYDHIGFNAAYEAKKAREG